jgi:hypothetical protein
VVMLGTDMKVAETPKEGLKDYAKADPYAEWLKKEGVKVYQNFYFPSLAKVELGPLGAKGRQRRGDSYRQSAHAQRLSRDRDQTRGQIRARASSI